FGEGAAEHREPDSFPAFFEAIQKRLTSLFVHASLLGPDRHVRMGPAEHREHAVQVLIAAEERQVITTALLELITDQRGDRRQRGPAVAVTGRDAVADAHL